MKAITGFPPDDQDRQGWPWNVHGNPVPPYSDDPAAWPRLTVIMPSYNQAEFIDESIRSVLLQNYPNLEFMIFDGGSTDDTLAVIRKYEPWITYWESKSDRGQSHAINKGFCRSTGDYIAWLNSDDLYYPGALFAISRAIKKNPEAGMIYGAGAKIDMQSQVLIRIPYRPYNNKLLSTRFYILQQSSFVKRSILNHDKMVEEYLHYTMDWELSIRVSRKAPVMAIPDEIGMFRIHDKCKTSTGQYFRKREIALVGRQCNGITDKNYLIFKIFHPVFRYDLCNPGKPGTLRRYFCFYWRKALALVVDPDSHMMH